MKTVPVTINLTELELAVGINGQEIIEAALKRYTGLDAAILCGKVKLGTHIPFDLPAPVLVFINEWNSGKIAPNENRSFTIDIPENIITPSCSQKDFTFVPSAKKWEQVDNFRHI